ncbi:Endocytosis regulator [Didymella glomerata]|uniref:LDB19 N-terminal domain-containing protein n=2 Tax=Didymella TaxID=55170 RepID=A0A9P5BUE2_9PLEO|nr:hypothetical protein E8E12_001776 [Didymella heteroderae]KAJ4330162.1 Endocytosis regulator [Didymella glomerata]
MRLLAINTTKKRVVSKRCGCNYHIAEIYTWRFFTRSAVPPDGLHSFPFSCLLPGHLPATIDSSFATLDYYLSVDLTTSAGRCTYTRTIKIKRAVLSIDEVHWVRTFPPTSITASVKHPSVVHPTGDFVIGLRLSGMVQEKLDFRERWGLHRISWYIEETQKFIALPCSKHMQEPGDGCRRVLRDEVRVIASEDVKTGWRTDFETGVIDVEFNAACNISLKPLCNVESQCGINVKHNLVIRMVVAKERAPLVKLSETVVTGAALVLCAQSPLVFAECPETVVAWDKEEPPTYESASASPPSYSDACN